MKRFDKIIEQSFEEVALPEGHEARFVKRIERKRRIPRVVAAAISSAAILAIALFVVNRQPETTVLEQPEPTNLSQYAEFMMVSMTEEVLTLAKTRLDEDEYLKLEADYKQMLADLRELESQKNKMSKESYSRLMNRAAKISGKSTANTIHRVQKIEPNNYLTTK